MLEKSRTNKYVILLFIIVGSWSSLNAQGFYEWRIKETPIATEWIDKIDTTAPFPEYPRPQLVRNDWKNLNGLWNYVITDSSSLPPEVFNESILVPYPLESGLSGVRKQLMPWEAIWYKRCFSIDMRKQRRLVIHFGAVDYKCWVYLNGNIVGSHEGGYNSFSFDISKYLCDGRNEIMLKVIDPTEAGIGPHGKQTTNPQNIYYTSTSGIWKTVWLEPLPELYIKNIKILPNVDKSVVDVIVDAQDNLKVKIRVLENGRLKSEKIGNTSSRLSIKIKDPRLWSPDSPYLYDMDISLVENDKIVDQVKSYFGMRKVEIRKDSNGYNRIYLNNKYTYNLGVLDQGFWPEGLYTPPSNAAIMFDLNVIKSMGFNTIRKHIKIESSWWYYYADKIGLLVWQDFVNPNQSLVEGSKPAFERQIVETIEELKNHPSIITWVLFNERWGQYDQKRLTEWVKILDPTRLINGHSGELLYIDNKLRDTSERPYVSSDMVDIHTYPFPRIEKRIAEKTFVIGEFGGLGSNIDGHVWNDLKPGWGYGNLMSLQELDAAYRKIGDTLLSLEKRGLSASIYTQPFDVEDELNGLITYDRKILKMHLDTIRKINLKLLQSSGNYISLSSLLNLRTADSVSRKYVELLDEYKRGKDGKSFLRSLYLKAIQENDSIIAEDIVNAYLRKLGKANNLQKEDISFLSIAIKSINNIGFEYVVRNSKLILDAPEYERILSVAKELIRPYVKKQISQCDSLDASDKIREDASVKFGDIGNMVAMEEISLYYFIKHDDEKWLFWKNRLYESFIKQSSLIVINNDAWHVFSNRSDEKSLSEALNWVEYVIKKEPTANYYDTYSNLLYKLGRYNQAIAMQEKGLKLPKGNGDINQIVENYNKMKRNERTW